MFEISKRKLWDLFLIYIAINPLLDIIFGMSVYFDIELPLNINHIVRVIGIFLMFMLIDNKNKRIILVAYGVWIFFGALVSRYIGLSINTVTDISWNLKMLTALSLFFTVYTNYDREWFDLKKISYVLIISALIACASIIVSITGYGFPTYNEERWGVKGFFFTGNVISIFLLIVYPLVYLINNKKKILCCIVFLVSFVFLGTKTTIFGGIAITLVMVFLTFKEKGLFKRIMSEKKTKRIFLGISFVSLIVGIVIVGLYVNELYTEYTTKTYYNSLFDFILSNRMDQLKIIEEQIKGMSFGWKTIGLIFGFGYSRIEYEYKKVGNFHTIEMDLQGVLYNFGLVVLVILIIALAFVLFRSIRNVKNNATFVNITLLISMGVGIFHAIFAGHVFYEALSQNPFWIICALMVCASKESKHGYRIERKHR